MHEPGHGHAGGFPAQVLPPALPELVLARPALEDRLTAAARRRLVVVTADAGFGKSTLLATWSREAAVAWYTVTGDDRRVSRFAAGLLEAIRLRVPDVPADIALGLRGAGPDSDRREASRGRAFAAALAQVLHERLQRHVTLVIDDFHEVAEEPAAARVVEELIRQTPARLHLVVLGRGGLPFPVERLRGQGEVVELTAGDLAFGAAEVRALLELRLGEEASGLAEAVHRTTRGWPAAVTMAIEVLRGVPAGDRSAAIERLGRPRGPLFGYLAREVFELAPPAVRDLVAAVARLPRFSAATCAAMGLEDATRTIAELERRGVYIELDGSSGDGWYRLTPLVADFAGERLDPPGEQALLGAADWFADHGDERAALRTLLAVGRADRVEAYLRQRGEDLLAAGAVHEVIAAAELLPGPIDGPLEQLIGRARQVAGDWEGALRHFRNATQGPPLAAALAWRIGLIHHLRGEIREALAAYESDLDDDRAATRDVALLFAWRASARWLLGDTERCRADAERALAVATEVGDDQALAAAHTVAAMLAAAEGDRRANDAHYLLALDHATRAGDVLQTIRIRTNRGSRLLEEAAYEEAVAELEIAVRHADLAGFAAFRGLALANRGQARLRLGRLDEAMTDLIAARTIYQRIGSRMVAYALTNLGDVHRVRGDRVMARQAYEEAVALGEESGDLQALVPALSGLALVRLGDDPASARALVERAVAVTGGMGEVRASLAAARVALALGTSDEAAEHAARAEAAARERRDLSGLAEALELEGQATADPGRSAELLDESVRLWEQARDPVGAARAMVARSHHVPPREGIALCREAERRLRAVGARALAAAARERLAELEQRTRPALAIEALGGLRVLRDGVPVALTEWQSRKARDLLKVLVARHGRPVPREMVMEILWPEEDPDRLSNRLSVALTTLRGVLDPGRAHDAEHYVASDGQAITLRLDRVAVDVEGFLADAAAGLAAVRGGRRSEGVARLTDAEAVYGGEFLEEELYEDWAVPLREEARSTYVSVARALAREASADGDHEAAVRYLLRILERDAFDEGAHLALVRTLQAAARHGEARRAYRIYGSRMDEIGVESAPFPVAGEPGPAVS